MNFLRFARKPFQPCVLSSVLANLAAANEQVALSLKPDKLIQLTNRSLLLGKEESGRSVYLAATRQFIWPPSGPEPGVEMVGDFAAARR